MPIINRESCNDTAFFDRLRDCGAAVIDQQSAELQDMRPARIGLLNLMPAPVMEATELRWLRLISHTVLQIEPVLLKFDDDARDLPQSSRRHVLSRYTSFSQAVAENGLDGLIVTGDNQELRKDQTPQPFDELHYASKLRAVIDWADQNGCASIYSCLASHIALDHKYGVKREILPNKVFGVYEHAVVGTSPVTFAIDDFVRSPHSRWGNIPPDQLQSAGLTILAANEEIGWLLAEDSNNGARSTYIQGHPEYWRYDLHHEYTRDAAMPPSEYYPDNDPTRQPVLSWSGDARAILSNWIGTIYKNYSL